MNRPKPDPRFPWSERALKAWTTQAAGDYLHLDQWPPAPAATAAMLLEVKRTAAVAQYELDDVGVPGDKDAMCVFEDIARLAHEGLRAMAEKHRPRPPVLSRSEFGAWLARLKAEAHQELVEQNGEDGAAWIEHDGCHAEVASGGFCPGTPLAVCNGLYCEDHHVDWCQHCRHAAIRIAVPDSFVANIGEHVRTQIRAHRRTVADAARLLDCSVSAMSRRFTGQVPFDLNQIELLCRWLRLELSELIPRLATTMVTCPVWCWQGVGHGQLGDRVHTSRLATVAAHGDPNARAVKIDIEQSEFTAGDVIRRGPVAIRLTSDDGVLTARDARGLAQQLTFAALRLDALMAGAGEMSDSAAEDIPVKIPAATAGEIRERLVSDRSLG